MGTEGPDEIRRTERWFISRGVPHFIHDYSAARDVLTRALPLLSLIFLFEVLGALNFEWPWWGNALAILGGFAILSAGWVGLNLLRGRRPLARPTRVGFPEISAFVVIPALLPMAFGGQFPSALVTAGINLAIVTAIYFGTSYGVVAMTKWAMGRMVRQFGGILDLLVRTLPLLLISVTFLFLQVESWEVAAQLDDRFFWVVIAGFGVIATVFVVSRLPKEVGRLAEFGSWDDIRRLVAGTPMERAAVERRGVPTAKPLTRRQWGNVGLVVLFGQGLQILVVGTLLALFFTGFGIIALSGDLITRWSGGEIDKIWEFTLWGRDMVLSHELLRVSGFLASFSALYFTVSAITDATYREEFYEQVVSEVREAFAVRAVYLTALEPGRRHSAGVVERAAPD